MPDNDNDFTLKNPEDTPIAHVPAYPLIALESSSNRATIWGERNDLVDFFMSLLRAITNFPPDTNVNVSLFPSSWGPDSLKADFEVTLIE